MVNNGDTDVVEKIVAYNPDMILLDVMMPNINGLDVVKELHDKHTAFCARVIMLTSLENDVYLAKAIEHGVTTYIHKTDVKLEEIVATVERKYQYLLTL
jgi:DNA-binding NarL/FixJ family response regulator